MSAQTAVVLAAGEGTRLRPLTRNRPKPMLPAANRPVLEHVLDALVEAGLGRIVLVVGYRRERVQEHFGPTYRDVALEYVVQGKQLGSGHALLQARDAVEGPVLAVNGDRVIEASSIRQVADAFEEGDATAAMGVLERRNASRYGAVTLRGRDVAELVEKPDDDDYRLINGGVYAFEPSVFEAIDRTPREAGELALTDTITRLLGTERVRGSARAGSGSTPPTPGTCWRSRRNSSLAVARPNPRRREGVWVDDDATVHGEATLRRPVAVGPDCEVGPGAVVGPAVALGRNATVGPNTTVERSVVDTDSRIDAGSTLRDAVLGGDVHLGPATTIPGGPADVRVGPEVFEDQQLGAVVADRTRAGGDTCFEPGALVGPNVHIGTGAHVSGTVGEGTEVVR
jgi:Nucleoside-diphosphate-sugar pyrophosphorylase involved in lipopolysaccharide biosynthesis/translation initiation factor 2B, gamma/epsilon subunits (eIF-2Bgamma/eIF-2Bepsilon)